MPLRRAHTQEPFQENASSMSSFAQFNLDSRIMSAIERIGYKEPTPIQLQAIPVVMKGGDVMGAAPDGHGQDGELRSPAHRPHSSACEHLDVARPSSRARAHSDAYARAGRSGLCNMTQYAADTPLRVGVVYGGVDIRPQSTCSAAASKF